MSTVDDIFNAARRVVGDKPLFLLAGAGDLVNEKLRELPTKLTSLQEDYRDVPMKAAGNLVGQMFRANLKLGELYDDLTRRGEDVVAKMRGEPVYDDGDEPFVREPYLPEPVHKVAQPPVKKAAAKKAPAKEAAAKKTAAKKTAAKKAPTKKTAAKKTAAKKRPNDG
ncbi:MAG TPA: hypothetical protein VFN80_07215 [Acidothermaceae bacterium]|nr:hypothetical protein [Acidothermaceae bacterium]